MSEILIHWELSDRDAELFIDGLSCGLEDASVKSRETARKAYITFSHKFPAKAEKMREKSNPSLKVFHSEKYSITRLCNVNHFRHIIFSSGTTEAA